MNKFSAVVVAGITVAILCIISLGGYFGSIAKLIGQILLGGVLVLIIIGVGIFSYICLKAQAKKWSIGLLILVLLCVAGLYFLVFLI